MKAPVWLRRLVDGWKVPRRLKGLRKLYGDRISFTLDDAEEAHREFPDTFEIPPSQERQTLQAGQLVKLLFRISDERDTQVERTWVKVQEAAPSEYSGVLDNDPYCTEKIRHGMPVRFEPRHVIQIWRDDP